MLSETAEERAFGIDAETVLSQLEIGLHGVEPAQFPLLHIGYEPVWSIGAGGAPATRKRAPGHRGGRWVP